MSHSARPGPRCCTSWRRTAAVAPPAVFAFLLVTLLGALLPTSIDAAEELSFGRLAPKFEKAMRSEDADVRADAAAELASVADRRAAAALFEKAERFCRRRSAIDSEYAKRVESLARNEKRRSSRELGSRGTIDTTADTQRLKIRDQLDRARREWTSLDRTIHDLTTAAAQCVASLPDDDREHAMQDLVRSACGRHEPCVRAAAIEVLAGLGHEDAYAALTELFDVEIQPTSLRVLAVHSVASHLPTDEDGEAAVDLLLRSLEDPSAPVRTAAIGALSSLPDPRVAEALIEHLEHEKGRGLEDTVAALRRLTGRSLPADADRWRRWWNEEGGREAPLHGSTGLHGTAGAPTPTPPDAAASAGTDSHQYGASFYGIGTRSRRILFVLDISGSMEEHSRYDEGTKLELAKAELIRTLRSIERPAAFNLVFFGDDVQRWDPSGMIELDDRSLERAIRFVERQRAKGGTNLFGALRASFEIEGLSSLDGPTASADPGADTLYLLSDGKPNRGDVVDTTDILDTIRRWNRPRQMRIHTIGLGAEADHELLRALAESSGGRYVVRQ